MAVAVLKERIDEIAPEVGRMRERLHTLEASMSAVRHLARELVRIRKELPNLAEQAATRAIELDRQRTNERRREGMSLRNQRITLFFGGAAVVWAVAQTFIH